MAQSLATSPGSLDRATLFEGFDWDLAEDELPPVLTRSYALTTGTWGTRARSPTLPWQPAKVLAIVAYTQPITRAGVEHIRRTTSDSALDTLVVRGLVVPIELANT